MSEHANKIEQARRAYVAALGTRNEANARRELEKQIAAARSRDKRCA